MQIRRPNPQGLNPLDMLLWTFRRSEADVVCLYDALSALMQISTGANMLNFGYWEPGATPAEAQSSLCMKVARMAGLDTARTALDIGSGFSEPAAIWLCNFPHLRISCVNLNRTQLGFGRRFLKESASDPQGKITLVNSTATALPFSTGSVDSIIALESAQHFRPLSGFMSECRRTLVDGGRLVLAMPVMTGKSPLEMLRLGILSFTWSSEHYSLDEVKESVIRSGMTTNKLEMIGSRVYEPLADYYIRNRDTLRPKILESYPSYVEKLLSRSLVKMKKASEDKTIDYVLLSATR